MQDAGMQQEFHLMQEAIEAMGFLMKKAKIDLTAAIDPIRMELEVLKTYMERYYPGFAESCSKLSEEAIQLINPEWMGSQSPVNAVP